jgi:hypothetical protein
MCHANTVSLLSLKIYIETIPVVAYPNVTVCVKYASIEMCALTNEKGAYLIQGPQAGEYS